MCLPAIINKDATVMCQRQLRDAIHSSQSTPLHQLMMQLSTVVVNCRWIAHRWNLLISSLRRLGAEGWLYVWKVKRLCETCAGMSLPSASSPPPTPTPPNPIPNPSICIQVIVLSNYQTQTAKRRGSVGGGGDPSVFRVFALELCAHRVKVTVTHKRQLWLQKCNQEISARRKRCVSSPALLRSEVASYALEALGIPTASLCQHPLLLSFLFGAAARVPQGLLVNYTGASLFNTGWIHTWVPPHQTLPVLR